MKSIGLNSTNPRFSSERKWRVASLFRKYCKPKISFCMTHRDRLHQICRTLPANLEHNRRHKDFIEFVVVDFIQDNNFELWTFVKENFAEDLESGYLKYFSTRKLPYFHASIAKNTAHRLALGKILVNLDCDNFTGPNGGGVVLDLFAKSRNIFLHQSSEESDGYLYGNVGRIGYRRKDFMAIGGYDQLMLPMGAQDHDLIARLEAYGKKKISFDSAEFNRAIPNDKEYLHKATGIMDYAVMDSLNKKMSRYNIENNRIVANQNLRVIGIHPMDMRLNGVDEREYRWRISDI